MPKTIETLTSLPSSAPVIHMELLATGSRQRLMAIAREIDNQIGKRYYFHPDTRLYLVDDYAGKPALLCDGPDTDRVYLFAAGMDLVMPD